MISIAKKIALPQRLRRYRKPKSPRGLFGDLFVEAQLAHATLDNMSFVDAEPRMTPRAIMRAYERALKKEGDAFSYSEFVRTYFMLPEQAEPRTPREPKGERDDVRSHIVRMWDELTRGPDIPVHNGSLLSLPRRYVVPGGRFRSLFYWDSYFTLLGLIEGERLDLAEDLVENFAYIIRTYGFIPNGNRTYFLTRSNQPFFALMVEALAEKKGDEIFMRYLDEMNTEYEFWMRGTGTLPNAPSTAVASERVVRLADGTLLNRFYDASDLPREEMLADDIKAHPEEAERSVLYRNIRAVAESGWDFSSRWLSVPGEHTSNRAIDIIPVDLNTLLARYETVLARAYRVAGKPKHAARLEQASEKRVQALLQYCWSDEQEWFMDYVWTEGVRSSALTLAGVYPLWAGYVSESVAACMEEVLRSSFLREGGLVTTLLKSGEQWDAPNGWAPLQHLAITGLERYGFHLLAEDVARRFAVACFRMFKRFGAIMEKYNVDDPGELAGGGEYGIQDGFGWTNAVLLILMNRYGIEYIYEEI